MWRLLNKTNDLLTWRSWTSHTGRGRRSHPCPVQTTIWIITTTQSLTQIALSLQPHFPTDLENFGTWNGRNWFLNVGQVALFKKFFNGLLRDLHADHRMALVCKPGKNTRGKIERDKQPKQRYQMLQWCTFLYIPFHIDGFPTQRKEETHSGASGCNAINMALQHSVGKTNTHYTIPAQVSQIMISGLLYLWTCCWWKPIRPSCQRPSHSPRSITRSACGASMLPHVCWCQTEDKKQSKRGRHEKYICLESQRVPALAVWKNKCTKMEDN